MLHICSKNLTLLITIFTGMSALQSEQTHPRVNYQTNLRVKENMQYCRLMCMKINPDKPNELTD